MAFVIEPHEAQSALWRKLKEHYTERLELLRRKNDNAMDEAKTAKLRGQIAECKSFLALDEPPRPSSKSSADDF